MANHSDPHKIKHESIILANGRVQLRCPAFPAPCEYVRIVQVDEDGIEIKELVYWIESEFLEDLPDVLGALMGAMKQHFGKKGT